MRSKFVSVVFLISASNLSGCSVIQDWFPDKEKDYQFTAELPPLVIPPDLVQKPKLTPYVASTEIARKPNIANVFESTKAKVEKIPTSEAVTITRPALSEVEVPISKNEIQISLTHENTPSLNLNVPTARAWRIVGKALSRTGIEVTKHDLEMKQITVQVVEKNAQSQQEDSLFSDATSIFTGFMNNEQRYVLQFQETNEKTSVTVLDGDLQPLKNAASEKLLNTLFDAIKTDVSK